MLRCNEQVAGLVCLHQAVVEIWPASMLKWKELITCISQQHMSHVQHDYAQSRDQARQLR